MSTLSPYSLQHRSFVYRQIEAADYRQIGDGALPTRFDNSNTAADKPGLIDLCVLPRFGLRGTGAAAFLENRGWALPERPNQVSLNEQGEQLLRLGKQEYWCLANPTRDADSLPSESETRDQDQAIYPLFCQDSHAWFFLSGTQTAEILAKLCAVDLRDPAFPVGSIAQTSLARVGAIIVKQPINQVPGMSILSDSASANYLWQALLDAMGEFSGQVIGAECLLR